MEKKGMSSGWRTFDFGPETKSTLKNKRTKQKSTRLFANSKLIEVNNKSSKTNLNFYEKVTPTTIDDLAVHPKKIKELQDWLDLSFNRINNNNAHPELLVLSGPSGSGKTTTLTLLCKAKNIIISEWINPLDKNFEPCRGGKQFEKFLEFLVDSRYSSIFEEEGSKNITLIKDFPNIFLRKPDQFFEVLEQCCYRTWTPIVFICTEASSQALNLSRLLFPDEIILKYNIARINFNPCAVSYLKGAVKRAQIIAKENPGMFKQLDSNTVDSIVASSMGDIRNAMNQFYLSSLVGSNNIPTSVDSFAKSSNSNKRKRSTDKTLVIKQMCRDEALGLFHGLGRVLNPKLIQINNSWRLNCDIEKLIDGFSSQSNILYFLFENYLKYFGNLTDIKNATEILSFSENLLSDWENKQETLVFTMWLSVLGLMVNNKHRVSRWTQITGPKKTDTCAKIVTESKLLVTDNYYFNIIKRKEPDHIFKMKKRNFF